MIILDTKYSLQDLTIVPHITSDITSRSEINPFYEDGKYPLFTAPMSTIVNENNAMLFYENCINVIYPRNLSIELRLEKCKSNWVSFSLQEINDFFIKNRFQTDNKPIYLLIDIANGHMEILFSLVKELKELYDKCYIMVGNIANPKTYGTCIKYGVDYVRCGIGGGSGCLTTTQVGVHYPLASLLNEINEIKQKYLNFENVVLPKVIADGGIRGYSDIIKALALGADYVMCGFLFAKMYESASTPIIDKTNEMLYQQALQLKEEEMKKFLCKNKMVTKTFYGMSTKIAQKEISPYSTKLKTSEGVVKTILSEYTMKGWVENFDAYLRSAMSYCNSLTLEEFIGKQTLVVISQGTKDTINQ